ncbi:MAG: tyrosine-type recombinase/integrase, partial [Gammaproteobacteria bacterium]|nr:tyrosine-type recombinase/integrase [Gammaproteobacteria bacterium]
VTKALTQAATEPEEPKTMASEREVKLLPRALEALNNQKQYTFLKDQEIFQNPRTEERWTGDQPIRKTLWTSALKRAGVRYRRPYQTRHSYASMLLTDGERIQWVSGQLGHKDWGFTARTYAAYIPEDDPTAGDKTTAADKDRAVSNA